MNNKWIEELKVGDKVVVNARFSKTIGTVTKITPAGNIKVGNMLFTPFGSERGGNQWDRAFISQATPDLIEDITRCNTIKKTIRVMREIKSIDYEQAVAILKLLQRERENE